MIVYYKNIRLKKATLLFKELPFGMIMFILIR